MDPTVIDRVSRYLGFSNPILLEIANKAPTTYKRYTIPKKNGDTRVIYHPSKQTKAVQYALIETVLVDLPVHECAMGYRRGIKSPLRKNAERHAKFCFSVRIDFQEFFPSIRPNDLVLRLERHLGSKLSQAEIAFLTNILFVRLKGGLRGLAIGAPSSPIISNIVMYPLDEAIQSIASSISAESVYTRYADDLIFSVNSKGGCREFFHKVNNLVCETAFPKLKINESKTVFLSRKCRRTITGLFVTPDNRVSIGRGNKRYIRKLLHEFEQNKLEPKKISYLQGYLAYILDVEPDLYNRLVIKYRAETVNRALNMRKAI